MLILYSASAKLIDPKRTQSGRIDCWDSKENERNKSCVRMYSLIPSNTKKFVITRIFRKMLQTSCINPTKRDKRHLNTYKKWRFSLLFHHYINLHLALVLWCPRPPSSILCRCCGLCSLIRNRKINIVCGRRVRFPRRSKIEFYDKASNILLSFWHR